MASELQGNDYEIINEINVTPLVDVSLVLVIIFMVSVPLLLTPLNPVRLPAAKTLVEERRDAVFITLDKDRKLFLDRQEVDQARLKEALRQRLVSSDSKTVILRVDADTAYRDTKAILEMAQSAGAKNMLLATRQKKE